LFIIISDRNYPDYFPARPNFEMVVSTLQKTMNISVVPYINGRLWDRNIPSFYDKHAEKIGVKTPPSNVEATYNANNVALQVEFYGSNTTFGVMVCVNSSFSV